MNKPEIVDVSIADFEQNERQNYELMKVLDQGLTAYNRSAKPDPNAAPLVLVIKNEDVVTAGVIGRSAYGWMRVDIIWVHESLRGSGYGRQLMARVESIARDRGCLGIHLDTNGFQAPGFYKKLGYEVFGELADYPPGETHYYFKKSLIDNRDMNP